jgi:hypothetical protein
MASNTAAGPRRGRPNTNTAAAGGGGRGRGRNSSNNNTTARRNNNAGARGRRHTDAAVASIGDNNVGPIQHHATSTEIPILRDEVSLVHVTDKLVLMNQAVSVSSLIGSPFSCANRFVFRMY